MGEKTAIAWTQRTWNPWMGCTKVSPGCAHCYMFREQKRYGNDPAIVRRSKTTFTAPLAWNDPALVFTCSWSDWFHEAADVWRDEAWDIVRRTPHLTYQILTKRPERIAAHLPSDWGNGYANVWLGVSVENARFTHRIQTLCQIPARVRFLSCEPLLSEVSIPKDLRQHIHWVIAGGESGPDARPMEIAWARWLRDTCAYATPPIPFFMKQDSGPISGLRGRITDDLWIQEMPNATR